MKTRIGEGARRLLPIFTAFLFCVWTAGQEGSCFGSQIQSVPSRPTIASATDTTQCGVVELEYGIERVSIEANSRRADLSGGIRFGVTPRLDVHWSSGNFLSIADAAGIRTGYGDNWLGLKYRLRDKGRHSPGLGVMYTGKIPTGDSHRGLSSGETDHAFSILASQDVWRLHFDFNVIPQWVGSSHGRADRNTVLALATSLPVSRRTTLIVEAYGATELNAITPGYSSVMGGCLFKLNARTFLDGGVDGGLAGVAPRWRAYGGVTVAMGSVYGWLRSPRT